MAVIVYEPKYTSEAAVERLVQFNIDVDTKPSSSEVLEWIELIEKEIDSRRLGWKDGGSEGDGYVVTDLYLDVPKTTEEDEATPLEIITGKYITKLLLTNYPILTMTSLERRTTSQLKSKPTWESLTQGYYEGWTEASGTDYMLLMDEGKDGQRYGIGFIFYSSKRPKEGRASLKASFTYSYNVPGEVLKEYATLKVAIEVLKASVTAGEPTRLTSYPGGDFQEYIPREMSEQIKQWKARLKEIEKDHFPDTHSGPISL